MATVSITAQPTTADFPCPEGCPQLITVTVTVEFTTYRDGPFNHLVGHAILESQPIWDHVLFWHGPDDPAADG